MADDYSVGELGRIVAAAAVFPRPAADADVELVVRRLRSWTIAGALLPIDDPHSGTGRHRRYANSAVYCASVLNDLAVNDQSIGVLVAIGRLVRNLSGPAPLLAGASVERWQRAVAGTAEIFLVHRGGLSVREADAATAGLENFLVGMIILGQELHPALQGLNGGVVVNLTRVFARLPR